MMTHATTRKAGLFLGCAGLAIAGSLALAPQRAAAQAFQATPTVVQGGATIDRAVPNQDTITVNTMDTVIDWVPDEDGLGNALTFLPNGSTAIFQNNIANPDFGVLNRILPATNGNVAVIDGAIISQIQSGAATVTGGNVAFYSPTGLLIGSNATFDVGRLVLTSISPDITQIGNFWGGSSPLAFTGVTGDATNVTISAGATITATPEGSFLVVAAPSINMDGLANINGSTVYAAGQEVTLTYNAGLFDISIPVGTTVGSAITHTGTTTGPASTGVGDNQVIYGVARAAASPMTAFFSGNLGFQPAAVAGVDNGDIILAANYDVLGRTVDGGTITDGINALFDGDSATSTTATNLLVNNIAATSDLLAIGSDFTQINGSTADSSFTGDLLIVGRNQAILNSNVGFTTSVDGDLLVTANDYGAIGSGGLGNDPNATAGNAFIDPVGGTITVGGDVTITADAVAGTDTDTSNFGSATGGSAQIFASGGTIDIVGNSILTATASQRGGAINDGGLKQGGFTRIGTQGGGSVTLQGDATLSSDAFGGDVSAGGVSSGIDATGGTASVEILAGVGGGTLTIQGDLDLDANAAGGAGSAAGAGSTATAGVAFVGSQDALGTVNVNGSVSVQASAFGGDNSAVGGTGGNANGGDAEVYTLQGGIVNIGGAVSARGDAFGGDGGSGGNGIGGIGGVFGDIGTITIGSDVNVSSIAFGGDANVGFGGQGGLGQGGQAFVQANGTLTEDATITIGGNVQAFVSAGGGSGGAGDGSAIAPGAGGEGRAGIISTPNPLRPAFGNGGYVLAQGDRGFLTVTGTVAVTAIGQGGAGGIAGPGQTGGVGGGGFGGTAQAGSFTGNGDGSVASGVVNFGNVTNDASAAGGAGGADSLTGAITGQGGDALAGDAFLTSRVGVVNANTLQLNAIGQGGLGGLGGDGTGGSTGLLVVAASTTNVASYAGDAQGRGGDGQTGSGGTGTGGTSFIGFQGGTIGVTGDVSVNASGTGGASTNADGGAGLGGLADIATFTAVAGDATIGGFAEVLANGIGGDALSSGFTGGTGTGGEAYLRTEVGGTLTIDSARVVAGGQGGTGPDANGGTGIGGQAYIEANSPGSTITIANEPTNFVSGLAQGSIVAANGIGGQTTGGAGIGGAGQGGSASVMASGGVIDLPAAPATTGFVRVTARGIGGQTTVDGGTGGTGTGGIGTFGAEDGGFLTSGDLLLSVFGSGGQSFDNGLNIDGGDGVGGTRTVFATNGGTVTFQSNGGVAGGLGGTGSGTGNGGAGSGGNAQLLVDGGTVNLTGRTIIATQNSGGEAAGTGNGGNAADGQATAIISNGGIVNLAGNELLVGNASLGGSGTTGGDAINGGTAQVLITNGTISGGTLTLSSIANAGSDANGTNRGSATASFSLLTLDSGAVVDVSTLNLFANATGDATSAEIIGGPAGIVMTNTLGAANPQLSAGVLNIEANSTGGVVQDAGQIAVRVDAGQASIDTFTGSATGAASSRQSFLRAANGGVLQILNSATLDVAGDILFATANGGQILGGNNPADLTASFAFTTPGLITITGDDDNVPSFGALSMLLSSSDIDIPFGARFGALDLQLVSTNTEAPALIGGTASGPGYTLDQDEAARIEAGSVSFVAPALGTDPVRAPDVEVADITIAGSQDDGPSNVSLLTDGIVGITGLVNYTFAAPTDSFQIIAGERIQFVTPSPSDPVTDLDGFPVSGAGQIYMNNADGELSGFLFLGAPSIFAAEADLLAQIIDDPNLPGLADLLSDPGGRSDPTVTIAANNVSLVGEEFIYFQNVGTSTLPSAIAVGPATSSSSSSGTEANFFLAQSSDSLPGLMEAIVFGLQVNADGSFTSGSDFFPLAEFNMEPANHFTETSTLNGCFIVTGECSGISGGPIEEAPPINNPAIIEEPVIGEPTEPGEEESDSEFGMDFPGLIDAPVVTEDGVVDDPVTSGGDSALYSGEDDEDEDEEADDAE